LREAHGETGGEHLAAMLGLPPRTLRNYENGCTMPAEILLAVIAISNVHPHWLATGLGPKYLPNPANDRRDSDPGCAA
jgi:hypothetical protein